MRIGNYISGMEVTLSPDEFTVLTNGNGDRVNVTLGEGADKDWIFIESNKQGIYRLGKARPNGTRSMRLNVPKAHGFKKFGSESVKSWTPGKGKLYGHKPTMASTPIQRVMGNKRRVRPGSRKPVISHAHLHEAIRLINNFLRSEDAAKATVDEMGFVHLSIAIEFGK